MQMKNKTLTAFVRFHDVDGNTIEKTYCGYPNVNWLLDIINNEITDEDNFHKTYSEKFPGINGIIDISKSLNITIMLQ